jgi:hypothetical protein
MAEALGITVFGTSAKYLSAQEKAGVRVVGEPAVSDSIEGRPVANTEALAQYPDRQELKQA